MKRFYLKCFCLFLAVCGGLLPQGAFAEFVCVSDISYNWAKQGSSGQGKSGVTTQGPVAKGAQGTPGAIIASTPSSRETPDGTDAPVSHVRFASITRTGADEEGAKASLLLEVNRQKGRAAEHCKRDHESFGDCLATKLSTKAGVLNSLSFATRSQVEQALTQECQAQQGTCLGVDSSGPICREITPAPDAAPKAKGAEPGKKEESKTKSPKKK